MLFNPSLTTPTPVALLGLPLDSIMSTQGVMVMLLVAYAGAMWMFLKSAPKVYTIMVSDLEVARRFYEGMLNLSTAEVPLHYYYNYEQTLGTAGLDPMYLGGATSFANQGALSSPEGLWYQLRKNTQLHIVSGASLGHRNQQRHVCFDHNCLEYILMRVQLSGVQHKIRQEKPLNFLVRDYDNQVIELAEIDD
ncbi:glyoxalase-like domain protein [Leptolyngbya sp. KIOST-1]|uniref:glyoxalase-like domain protein n=1 Tax=Leptolyngbya sp. KIOST-1 TaxID=1229172 RepID=UPI00056A7828|nr:glyoxalase-like domain protein [Leptolyngbya sp. KIOST-1]